MQDIAQQIGELVAAGNKIGAIKLLREASGMGLAEAKDIIDAVAAGKPLGPFTARHPAGRVADPGGADLPDDVRAAAIAGQRIEAIKLLRQHRGLGLKEAKDLLDAAVPVPAGAKRGCLLPLLCGALVGAACWLG